ncbi:glycosyltransferase [Vreelandella aquamarina]|uniref:glycosyltransferase n=1 Tax=Vreelandella aquamarina TaxID=77097 RepID=UPI000780B032|nr:glycosyltransferase [Halomonas axialensis]
MKNLVFFWDGASTPDEVSAIVGKFKRGWGYRVSLFNDESASSFIQEEFGVEASDLFNDCRIPAMRSDLFRLMYLYVNGGIYIDVKFTPKSLPPDDILEKLMCVDMVLCRWFHGRIVNGFFAARKNSYMLNSLLDAALSNILNKSGSNIFSITGPGMWAKEISGFVESEDYFVVEHDEVFKNYLNKRKFLLSGRGGGDHWSERQKKEPLYYSDIA